MKFNENLMKINENLMKTLCKINDHGPIGPDPWAGPGPVKKKEEKTLRKKDKLI